MSQALAVLWSTDLLFPECAEELFSMIRTCEGRIRLVLDDYIISTSSLSLEQVPEENKNCILRAQAAQLLGVPEEHVRFYFAPILDDGPILRGTVYCCDVRDLSSLLTLFRRESISLDTVSVPGHPEFVFFDKKEAVHRQLRDRRRTIAALLLTLFCGLGTHVLQRAAETIAEYTQDKQLELGAARAECSMLKNKVIFRTKERAFVIKAEQQRKRLSSFFTGLADARPADVLPQKVMVDCVRSLVEVEGVSRTADAAPVYVEKLSRSVLSEVSMTSLEHDRAAYRFRIEGVL